MWCQGKVDHRWCIFHEKIGFVFFKYFFAVNAALKCFFNEISSGGEGQFFLQMNLAVEMIFNEISTENFFQIFFNETNSGGSNCFCNEFSSKTQIVKSE
jgi:hypothetical protein